jgi:hypothetical protein
MYSSTLSLSSALDRGWVVNATPRALYPREIPGTIVKEAGWAPGPVWTGVENLDRPARSELLYRCAILAHDVLENGSFIKT